MYAYIFEFIEAVTNADLDTCIGYNSLFVIPQTDQHNGKELPDGKRLWTWLILCNDGKFAIGDTRMLC